MMFNEKLFERKISFDGCQGCCFFSTFCDIGRYYDKEELGCKYGKHNFIFVKRDVSTEIDKELQNNYKLEN